MIKQELIDKINLIIVTNTSQDIKAVEVNELLRDVVDYLTKENIGLSNVENKSSSDIRSEITDTDIPSTITRDSELAEAIADLVDSSPLALDTLKELADALGDDPDFARTITNLIATKLALTGGVMTGDIDMGGNHILNLPFKEPIHQPLMMLAEGNNDFVILASCFPAAKSEKTPADGLDIEWGLLGNTDSYGSSFISGVEIDKNTKGLKVNYPAVKAILGFTISNSKKGTKRNVCFGSESYLNNTLIYANRPSSVSGFHLTGNGTDWNAEGYASAAYSLFNFAVDGLYTLENTAKTKELDYRDVQINYYGENNYRVKRKWDSLKGNAVAFYLVDYTTNIVVTAAPTSNDHLIISNYGTYYFRVNLSGWEISPSVVNGIPNALRTPFLKMTAADTPIELNATTTFRIGISQTYPSYTGNIYGLTLVAALDELGRVGVASTIDVYIKIYNVDELMRPTTEISSKLVTINDVGYAEQSLMFDSPVAVSGVYAVALELNPLNTSDSLWYVTNSSTATPPDGLNEGLFAVEFAGGGGWINLFRQFGGQKDVDALISPIVETTYITGQGDNDFLYGDKFNVVGKFELWMKISNISSTENLAKWQPKTGVTIYNLYRDTQEDLSTKALVYSGTNLYFIDNGLTADTKYYYELEDQTNTEITRFNIKTKV